MEKISAYAKLISDFQSLGLHDHPEVAVVVYLAATTRLTPEKLPVIVAGPSSAGKSYSVKLALSLIPESAIMEISQITPAALQRLEDITNIVIYIQEACSDSALSDKLKLLASEGILRNRIVIGGVETEIVLKGPCVCIETCINPKTVGFERSNRSFVISVEPTAEELLARFDGIKHRWAQSDDASTRTADEIIKSHHDIQAQLKTVERVVMLIRLCRQKWRRLTNSPTIQRRTLIPKK
jgi:hypothetical protein